LDLADLLTSGRYQWDGHRPAAEDDLARLVAGTPVPLPASYLAFLRRSDGGSGMFSGYPSYVRLWPASTVVDRNDGYGVWASLPGFVAIGDNGGPDMVGFDTRQGDPYSVLSIPFLPMDWAGAIGQAASFETFLARLLPEPGK
jgi:hypothetical protein